MRGAVDEPVIRGRKQQRRAQERVATVGVNIDVRTRGSIGDGGIDSSSGDSVSSVSSVSVAAEALIAHAVRPTWKHDCKRERRAGTLGGIVGFGEGATGELFLVEIGGRVVQVVPEPASVVMMLAGAALLLGWRARSR
jgi:hypothetical protein